eukprot:1780944-Rhodomonas_salina.4
MVREKRQLNKTLCHLRSRCQAASPSWSQLSSSTTELNSLSAFRRNVRHTHLEARQPALDIVTLRPGIQLLRAVRNWPTSQPGFTSSQTASRATEIRIQQKQTRQRGSRGHGGRGWNSGCG